jgi:hypothetical protein
MFFQIRRALHRARFAILTMSAANLIGLFAGMIMVHSGNRFALDYRDRIVGQASDTSPILKSFRQGNRSMAAVLDAGANLMAAVPTSLAGYWAPGPFPIALFRGWIGGIVSVDRQHRSRLAGAEAVYYLTVLVLQLIPYILAVGAGVNLGLARARPIGDYAGPKLLGVPQESIRDAGRIYLLVVPLFALASAFEFFAR